MKKLSSITESIWGDIRKQGLGDKVKKEDELDSISRKALDEYIELFINRISGKMGFTNTLNDFLWYIEKQKEVVKDLFHITPDVPLLRDYAEKNWKNIRAIIQAGVEEENKKISESVWSDIRKRGNGVDVKKEDDLTNIRELVPVDMGVSVLWADRDLERKDGNCYFDFNEASNIIKNSKWRIPTKQESYELFQYTTMIKNTDEVCIQEGKFDDKPQLIFDKKGYQYGDDDKVFQKSTYAMWTSTEVIKNEAYDMCVIARINNTHFTSMHYGNRICVRLVQDRN